MAVKEVLKWPNPLLTAAGAAVETLDKSIKTLLQDLADTLRHHGAMGLAAPQIGVGAAVCVVNSGFALPGVAPVFLVNPKIIWRSPAIEDSSEGCLSAPGLYLRILRSDKIKVQCRDAAWQEIELEASGYLAKIIQHEVDHLDGKMMWDRLSALRRDMILRKLAKGRL